MPTYKKINRATLQAQAELMIDDNNAQGIDYLDVLQNIGDVAESVLFKEDLTTRGDVFVRGVNDVVRLGLGSSGQVLGSNGTDLVWQDLGVSVSGTANRMAKFTAANVLGNSILEEPASNRVQPTGDNTVELGGTTRRFSRGHFVIADAALLSIREANEQKGFLHFNPNSGGAIEFHTDGNNFRLNDNDRSYLTITPSNGATILGGLKVTLSAAAVGNLTGDEFVTRNSISGDLRRVTLSSLVTNLGFALAGSFVGIGGNTGSNTRIKVKVLEIGDWDIPALGTTTVAHGLSIGQIRSVSASIRNDQNSVVSDLSSNGIVTWSGSFVTLSTTGFDSTAYDSTSYNRGWVTIIYEDLAT